MRKDRYPLPLINETLEKVSKATWFTKLDVIAAFHKLRVDPKSQWMTAFQTQYSLYEWLVTPFGLANAPSSFQRYINWALREFLDEFTSAYIDNILVFTTGSLHKHREHAVVKCLKEWESDLRSVRRFLVITDHKNLTYFTTTKKLNERQIRWQEYLSQFNFHIEYRPGKEGTLPDVLSHQEQDMQTGSDDRFTHREARLLDPEMLVGFPIGTSCIHVYAAPVRVSPSNQPVSPTPLQDNDANDKVTQELHHLWHQSAEGDAQLQGALAAV